MSAARCAPAPTAASAPGRAPRPQRSPKDPTTAWLLWIFLGVLGAHRYYLGDWRTAVPMTLTLGLLGLWSLADGIVLGRRLERINAGRL
ncbi:TM2 domain-containing protein [Kocuria rhizosphaericola]|uniref:TM2 domain-containing protein n=1 Tax=Kocuria rhizosphaericola TaxID=3376284 RepID=UPI003790AC90